MLTFHQIGNDDGPSIMGGVCALIAELSEKGLGFDLTLVIEEKSAGFILWAP